MTDSCLGECCAAFPLPGIARLRARAADPGAEGDPEAAYILDMIIPLSAEEARARYVQLGYGKPPAWMKAEAKAGRLFTCRHWDTETRLCGAYEARPTLCRDFPYNAPCDRGCGYSSPPEVVAKWDELRAAKA